MRSWIYWPKLWNRKILFATNYLKWQHCELLKGMFYIERVYFAEWIASHSHSDDHTIAFIHSNIIVPQYYHLEKKKKIELPMQQKV